MKGNKGLALLLVLIWLALGAFLVALIGFYDKNGLAPVFITRLVRFYCVASLPMALFLAWLRRKENDFFDRLSRSGRMAFCLAAALLLLPGAAWLAGVGKGAGMILPAIVLLAADPLLFLSLGIVWKEKLAGFFLTAAACELAFAAGVRIFWEVPCADICGYALFYLLLSLLALSVLRGAARLRK